MGVKQLSNPHHFVQEAAQAGVYYEDLIEACECAGTQKVSRMFAGRSVRGSSGHISGVTIDNWITTFKFSKENPTILDSNQYQARSITPTNEWFEYIKILRSPIEDTVVNSWKGLSQTALGNAAEKIGITKGIRNGSSIQTLYTRMIDSVNRRKKSLWIENETPIPNNSETDYMFMNIFQIHDECKKRGIVIGKQIKTVLIEKIKNYDKNPVIVDDINDYNKLTKKELQTICKNRGFILYNKFNKSTIIEHLRKDDAKQVVKINVEIGAEAEDNDTRITPTIHQYQLELEDGCMYDIPVREDGYVNATAICKAGNKMFGHWNALDSTKALIQVLSSDIHYPISHFIESYKGNSSAFAQGSWVHPDLAIQLAQWVSPKFAIQVSRWIRELFSKGTVTLERPVKAITDMSQIDIEAEILETEYDWSQNTNCNCLYIAYIGNGMLKIGTSDSRISARIAKHTSSESLYSQFRILSTSEISSRIIENEIHSLLKQYQVSFNRQKEIYKPPNTLREFIERVNRLLADNDHKLRADRLEKENTALRLELSLIKNC